MNDLDGRTQGFDRDAHRRDAPEFER